MGRTKTLKNLRRQVEAIEAEAKKNAPPVPRVRWWHRLPILGRWLYRREIMAWTVKIAIHHAARSVAARRTYQGSK